ncbi:biotin--[acetyl-CoA-carboxylase] ligase [Ornithinimicrobium faecis]|uniref:biotin--[acetyl-CoA-carboxylase] ligase n=1 Tax=Ornithinimicrobium faecis TaxID=2934158 RepID=UPI002117A7F1|nr:biotin--[acetyl-CoA-carboxylase] ligase [Ornithinimicrobium sp. HY1745]
MTHISWERPQWHPSIDSTNLEAARDPRPGRVIVADHQSAGLGRRGRTWTAPPDSSVAISVVIPAPAPELIGWVPLVTGLAVAQALEDSPYAVPVTLKWPNDVLVREQGQGEGGQGEQGQGEQGQGEQGQGEDEQAGPWHKICGVLAQAIPVTPAGPVVVVGAGINIDQTRDQLPVPTATSWRLARGGDRGAPLPDGARQQLVSDYLARLADLVTDLGGGHTAYRQKCSTLGQQVEVHLPEGGTRTGTAVEVDDSGALVVEGGGRRTVHLAGDVVHVRPAR